MNPGAEIDVARLKRDVIECTGPGKRFTRRGLSLKASGDKNPDLVRDFLSRGQDKKPSLALVAGLARAMGKPTDEYLVGVSSTSSDDRILVLGSVEAGVWREQSEWPSDQRYTIEVGPSRFPGVERFGLRVEGFSMDRVFPPGTELECYRVSFQPGALRPQSGDLVIVQRTMGDLHETTCKWLETDDSGGYWLRPDSTKPDFQERIFLGRPDIDHVGDGEAEVIGIVDRSYRSHMRR